jgi:hypothetical protein
LSTEGFKEEEESLGRPLSCSEAILLIPNGETILKNWDITEEEKHISLSRFFFKKYPDFIDLEEDIQCDLIILKKINDVCFKLLHDNRFMAKRQKKTYNTFFGII